MKNYPKERSVWRLVILLTLLVAAILLGSHGFYLLAVVPAVMTGGYSGFWMSHKCGDCGTWRTTVSREFVQGDGRQGPGHWDRKLHCFKCNTDHPLPNHWDLADRVSGLSD